MGMQREFIALFKRIECFHSRGQPCTFVGGKECVLYLRKDFNFEAVM